MFTSTDTGLLYLIIGAVVGFLAGFICGMYWAGPGWEWENTEDDDDPRES